MKTSQIERKTPDRKCSGQLRSALRGEPDRKRSTLWVRSAVTQVKPAVNNQERNTMTTIHRDGHTIEALDPLPTNRPKNGASWHQVTCSCGWTRKYVSHYRHARQAHPRESQASQPMTAARAASDALILALLSLAERGLRTHFGAHIIETGTHSYRLTATLVQRAG
jgi:hypothetical protein